MLLLLLMLPSAVAAGTACADECLLGDTDGRARCLLRDRAAAAWVDRVDDGAGQLHNRARVYTSWLRKYMLPAGGVMRALFTDATYRQVQSYGGERDSAIWTGTYLASEALRYAATGAQDAREQVARLVETLHRWWTIPSDRGYLARYAAPEASAPPVLAILDPSDPEVYRADVDGRPWRWRGNTSRDQYQGVLLGYLLAYELAADERLRALIREDVVRFAEQLMERRRQRVQVKVDGARPVTVELELQHVLYHRAATADSTPRLNIAVGDWEVTGDGILVFWPNPSEFVRRIPGFGWVPNVELPTQAIQLAAAFRAALRVTDGAAGYETRRAALLDHYERHVGDWLDTAADWRLRQDCGEAYFGANIAFLPAYLWARLETDPARRERIRREVLRDGLWSEVRDHKNVLFAFLYAAQAVPGDAIDAVVAEHVQQLERFPSAPNLATPRDLRGRYPQSGACRGLSALAVDVDERVPTSFVWERHPWTLYDPGTPHRMFPGVDYLLAYWLGRDAGFIADDAPETCLRWKGRVPAEAAIPGRGGWRAILQ